MKKILVLVGTRPEAIKMSPVFMALQHMGGFEVKLCATGQHREMLSQALADFGLSPDINLDLMQPDQTLAGLTSSLCLALDKLYKEEKPDMVLVQGDTTTVMTAALIAFYQQIKIGHVEAGLRSFDKLRPFPEEINRKIAGCMADLHFAPTEQSKQNLLNEGVKKEDIFVTGNTVIDALLHIAESVRNEPELLPLVVRQLLEQKKKIILVTGHRRESFDGGFEHICHGIRNLADQREDIAFVYPVHLNPKVKGPVYELLSDHPRIHLIAPLSYRPFVALMQASHLVLTDSGGVQEEAPSLGKPVLVMRSVTERPEGIAAGNARLVGANTLAIEENISDLLNNQASYQAMSQAHNPYGDGHSAGHIANIIKDYWKV